MASYPSLDNPNYYIAHLPICNNCSEKLEIKKTEFPHQFRGKCPKCGKEFIVQKETRYHMRRVRLLE